MLLLVVLGLAAAGSPGSLHPGDPALWLAAALAVLAAGGLVWAGAALLWRHLDVKPTVERHRWDNTGWQVALLILVVVAGMGLAFSLLPAGNTTPRANPPLTPRTARLAQPIGHPSSGGGVNVGPALVLVLGVLVLGLLVWVAVHRLRANRPVEAAELVPGDPLIAAIEAALLDLDGERDPRRAVIKAYARTESVLRASGLPRRPAETPLEYLDRVLRELGARAGAVDRLTELFERAAFSRHVIGAEMRDEAVAAFIGLRDDLLASPDGPP